MMVFKDSLFDYRLHDFSCLRKNLEIRHRQLSGWHGKLHHEL